MLCYCQMLNDIAFVITFTPSLVSSGLERYRVRKIPFSRNSRLLILTVWLLCPHKVLRKYALRNKPALKIIYRRFFRYSHKKSSLTQILWTKDLAVNCDTACKNSREIQRDKLKQKFNMKDYFAKSCHESWP